MTDFYQGGVVTTFHKLGVFNLLKMEEELASHCFNRPIALVLPCLYSELSHDALKGIVRHLKEVKYIREIVISLGLASADNFKEARQYFSMLPQKTKILWLDGHKIRSIFLKIQEAGLAVGEAGKGRAAWMAYGYVLSRHDFHAIAVHNCDIVTYDRELLARLCYPVVNPYLDYDFCKGYYSRVTDRMYGRVTRLLMTPLIKSLQKMIGNHPLLDFFDSFRYSLAAEFSMDMDLVRMIRIPGDGGLQVGVLAEVYKNASLRRVCQIDIARNYDHKHQVLSPDDPTKGLHKMSVDICKSLFRTLSSEGIVFSDGFFKSLTATYVGAAREMVKKFEDDAMVNGLNFDRHEESLGVETFTRGIKKAAEAIMSDPLGVPLIASWDRVISAMPGILDTIKTSVEEDNA